MDSANEASPTLMMGRSVLDIALADFKSCDWRFIGRSDSIASGRSASDHARGKPDRLRIALGQYHSSL